MGRILDAIGAGVAAFRSKRSTPGRDAFSDDWVSPTVGNWARAFQEIGLRHDHGRMVGMAVQWVGICSKFNAVQCAAPANRLYRKGGSKGMTGRWAGAKVKSRRRIDYLRTRSGRKSSQYSEMAGDVEEVIDHPILTLLNKPNPWMGGIEYARRLYLSGELTGNMYEYRAEDAMAIQLLPLLPQWTRVQPDGEDLIRGYKYGSDESVAQRYRSEDVMHHRHMPAPNNLWYGVGPLADILAESNIFGMAIDYELNGMVNGIRPSEVVITAGPDTQDPMMDQIRAYLAKWHKGPGKSGNPLLLRDAEATLLSRTAVDMEYREGMRDIKAMTLTSYGIPEQLLMRGEGGGLSESGSTQGKAQEIYANTTVLPRIVSVNELRNSQLFDWFGVEPGELWLACDDPAPPSREDLREDAKVMVPIGVMTPNEAREALSLEADPEGDVLRFQGKSMETMDRPPPDPQAVGPDGKPKPIDKLKPGDKAYHTKDVGPDDSHTRKAELMMRKAVADWFAKSAPEYLAGVSFETASVTATLKPETMAKFVESVQPAQEVAYLRGFNVAASITIDVSPVKAIGEAAAKVMEANSLELIKGIDETTRDMLRTTMADGIKDGETRTQIVQRVAQVLGPGNEVRADLIAATETTRVFNKARLDAWSQSSMRLKKQWLKSGDPCPICDRLGDLEPVGLDDEFETGIKQPPDSHPFCRCGLGMVLEKDQ